MVAFEQTGRVKGAYKNLTNHSDNGIGSLASRRHLHLDVEFTGNRKHRGCEQRLIRYSFFDFLNFMDGEFDNSNILAFMFDYSRSMKKSP